MSFAPAFDLLGETSSRRIPAAGRRRRQGPNPSRTRPPQRPRCSSENHVGSTTAARHKNRSFASPPVALSGRSARCGRFFSLGQHSIEGPVAKGAAGDREVGEANTGPGSPACLSRVRTARSVADPHRCGIRRSCAADTGIDACPRCSQRPRPPALVDTQAALAGRSAVIRQL